MKARWEPLDERNAQTCGHLAGATGWANYIKSRVPPVCAGCYPARGEFSPSCPTHGDGSDFDGPRPKLGRPST